MQRREKHEKLTIRHVIQISSILWFIISNQRQKLHPPADFQTFSCNLKISWFFAENTVENFVENSTSANHAQSQHIGAVFNACFEYRIKKIYKKWYHVTNRRFFIFFSPSHFFIRLLHPCTSRSPRVLHCFDTMKTQAVNMIYWNNFYPCAKLWNSHFFKNFRKFFCEKVIFTPKG